VLEKFLSAPPPLAARTRSNGGRARSSRGRAARPRATPPAAGPDGGLLAQVRQALTDASDGLAKSVIVAATGATAGPVDAALRQLMASGTVIKTGRGPGTRYRLNPGS
jgi:hypothetical protein